MVKTHSPWRPHRKRGVHANRRRSRTAHVREYLWPSMGPRAFVRWLLLGLRRQAERPHYVALGFACGVWTAFFPLLGTHLVVLALLCWVLRASVIAGLAGTVVGNPWTYGLIWASSYRMGRWLLHIPPGQGRATDALHDLHWHTLLHDISLVGHDVIWPTMLGGMVLGLPVAALFYGLVYWQVRLFHERKKRQ
jgi:hypothetical protein